MGKMIPNVTLWQYYLSYLKEITLDSFYSDKNGDVALFLRKGRLMLCAQNAIYSYDDKYHNFVYAFRQLDKEILKSCREVLVLGMGLASVPLILEQEYGPHFSFTMVEYDEDLVALAHDYSLPRISSPTEVVVADAWPYMLTNERSYDLICVDLFKDNFIPEAFLSTSFLEKCNDALTDNGLLIMNTPGNTTDESRQSRNFFERRFKDIFPEARCVHLFKNEMLFSR